jgi:hypothetical protein
MVPGEGIGYFTRELNSQAARFVPRSSTLGRLKRATGTFYLLLRKSPLCSILKHNEKKTYKSKSSFHGAWGGNRTLNPLRAQDFKSCAYTSSATQAGGASGNRTRASRFCRPQRYHFAIAPLLGRGSGNRPAPRSVWLSQTPLSKVYCFKSY